MPPRTGLVFVVVVHLDPTHESLMPELLSHITGLTVEQARDRQPVETDLFLPKPCLPDELAHDVRRFLDSTSAAERSVASTSSVCPAAMPRGPIGGRMELTRAATSVCPD
jgi:hypothetical protein